MSEAVAVIWGLNEKELVRISIEEFEKRFEDLYKEYEGLLRATVRRIFPKNMCSSGNGLLQDYDDLMQAAKCALFYAQTYYHVTVKGYPRKKKNEEQVDFSLVTAEKEVKETKASFTSYLISAVRQELVNLYVSQKLRKPDKSNSQMILKDIKWQRRWEEPPTKEEIEKVKISFALSKRNEEEQNTETSFVSVDYLPEKELDKLRCHRKVKNLEVKNPAEIFNEANLLEIASSGLDELEKTAFQMLYEGSTIKDIGEKIGGSIQQDFYTWIVSLKEKIKENKQLCLLLGKV